MPEPAWLRDEDELETPCPPEIEPPDEGGNDGGKGGKTGPPFPP